MNTLRLKPTACALGLYSYDCELPNSDLFQRYHSGLSRHLKSVGVSCTYFGAAGKGYPDDLRNLQSSSYKQLLGSSFRNITSLTLVANPIDSDAPAYDAYMSSSIGHSEPLKELLFSFVINDLFLEIGSSAYDELLRWAVSLRRWDFGFGFASSVDKQPEYHILGLDNGNLSTEEEESLYAWYSAPGEIRIRRLRDVYPYNVVHERQLATKLERGLTLRDYAEGQPNTLFKQLTDDGLYLWQIDDSAIMSRIRNDLKASQILVC